MKELRDLDCKNKKIIVRVDLNVPVLEGTITDHSRIHAILPTLEKLIKNKNKIFLIAHFGRPKGQVNKTYSIEFLCSELKKFLNLNTIHFLANCEKKIIETKIAEMDMGEICLLENIRFNAEEEKNDLNFSKLLASSFDIYINDAFSASHRNHASIVGITKYLPSYAGLSFSKEIENLDKFLENSEKPNLAIIGGSKVSTKVSILNNLIKKTDFIIIGGAMANSFLYANGQEIGHSMYQKDSKEIIRQIYSNAKKENCELVLPVDAVIADSLHKPKIIEECLIRDIPENKMILDIGEKSVSNFINKVQSCGSVLWNGPLGAFETQPFDKGTTTFARKIAELTQDKKIISVAGGGDTTHALNKAGVMSKFSYVSSAGGAFLEWIEGKDLPGITVLDRS